MTVAAVVLAAGASRRLGQPKQVLALDGATVLDATLAVALQSGCGQVVAVLGGGADLVRAEVDLSAVDVVENRDYGEGCATSIRTALGALSPETEGIVLMLGDQPRVRVDTIVSLVAAARGHAVGVCEYDDGLGHPLWFDRGMFDALEAMHGDKAVWKLVDAAGPEADVVRVRVPGAVPRDVDTWDDYQALLAGQA
ncbi:MAG: nucleotidyltransferase family protein [Marmoricola sp.]